MNKYQFFNARQYSVHSVIYNLIAKYSRVLDLGCATGYIGKKLLEKKCKVFGVEKDREAALQAKPYYDKVVVADLENSGSIKLPINFFDYVLLLDVIEHVTNREKLISNIKQWLNPEGLLIVSTPNIAHISIRSQLLFGRFEYTQTGILDENHVHFFTRKSLKKLLSKEYEIILLLSNADFGQLPIIGRVFKFVPTNCQNLITKIAPNLLATQFIAVCRKK